MDKRMTNGTALPGITNLPLYRAAVRLVMITREVITGNNAVTVSGNESLKRAQTPIERISVSIEKRRSTIGARRVTTRAGAHFACSRLSRSNSATVARSL